jgi:RNA polymerase sigma-70 factor (ECF subfamily)
MMGTMDPQRLSEWYDAYKDRLRLYARNWLTDEAAQDAVQSAFVRLMAQVLTPRDVQAWLFRTVRNEAITRLRQQQRVARLNGPLMDQQEPWFDGHVEDLIDARAAQQILMDLPDVQREVVLLRIWGQMSLQQVSQVVGSPLTTIHSRYKAALAAIRERMERPCKKTLD